MRGNEETTKGQMEGQGGREGGGEEKARNMLMLLLYSKYRRYTENIRMSAYI